MAVAMGPENVRGNETRAVHPFFEKKQGPHSQKPTSTTSLQDSESSSTVPSQSNKNSDPNSINGTEGHAVTEPFKCRELNSENLSNESSSSLSQYATASPPQIKLVFSPSKPNSFNNSSAAKTEAFHGNGLMGDHQDHSGLEEDPNIGRRKRQRTESPTPSTVPPGNALTTTPENSQSHTGSDSWLRQLEEHAASSQLDGSVQFVPDTPVAARHTPPSRKRSLSPSIAASDPPKEPGASVTGGSIPPTSQSIDLTLSSPVVNGRPRPVGTPDPEVVKVTPKKVLKLNRNGKLLSSPPKSSTNDQTGKEPRGRRKSRKPEELRGEIVVALKYGIDQNSKENTGSKINAIMNGSRRHSPAASVVPAPACVLTGPLKPTHPFFLGKAPWKPELAPDIAIDQAPASTRSGQTSRDSSRSPQKRSNIPIEHTVSKAPSTGFIGTFSQASKPTFPHTRIPIWPPADFAHVRGDQINIEDLRQESLPTLNPGTNKAKEPMFHIPGDESLLCQIAQHLFSDQVVLNDQRPLEASAQDSFRYPRRNLMNGIDLQNVISKDLSCDVKLKSAPAGGSPSTRPSLDRVSDQRRVHPSLLSIFTSIETSSTAFDKGACETLQWTVKYAPRCAENVLQIGPGPVMLRDWLRNLVVSGVDKGTFSKSSGGKGDHSKRKKKRQRKSVDDLNGFVISSEEEADEMDEISGSEDEVSRDDGPSRKKSMIRAGDSLHTIRSSQGNAQMTNAVLISGPSGCGKTALVHAIAHELGFEVFEINPGTRRTGKDIFDKVGDMTQNHLVHRSKEMEKSNSNDDSTPDSDITELEIKSGKQGTMNSFFKSKAQTTSKRRAARKIPVLETPARVQNQKQSLILFEEVDILFQDDKGFWPGALDLISQSKRPIIMTCNDEDLVPMDELQFHAILRFNPLPIDLAVDYLLLIAANEGHVLGRDAVASLYEGNKSDLRSSMNDLDFWCQMAIGDRKGGLEWMMDRWPPGADLDANGQKLKVTSTDTYLMGMGWLGGDALAENPPSSFDYDLKLMKEAFDSWEIDVMNIPDLQEFEISRGASEPPIESLRHYEVYLESLSVLDQLSGIDLKDARKDLLDSMQPDLSDKTLLNISEGYAFLQADVNTDLYSSKSRLATAIRAFSRPPWTARSTFQEGNLIETIKTKVDLGPRDAFVQGRLLNAFEHIIDAPAKFTDPAPGRQSGSFDSPVSVIAEDIAPYIRCIVRSDVQLERQRLELSNLLSRGAKPGKTRTTRASRAALEGGSKATTRKERYFPKKTNFSHVLSTAHKDWLDAVTRVDERARSGQADVGVASSQSSPGSSPGT